MITFIYAVLVFQVLRFSVTLFNFLSNPKLGYYGKHFGVPVSLIITGKRSEATDLLKSIANQDYKNIEVFFKDEQDEELLLTQVKGRYFLFLDAETTISKGLINNLIQRTKVFDLDLLSLIPRRTPKDFFEHCTIPFARLVTAQFIPSSFHKIKHPIAALCCQ